VGIGVHTVSTPSCRAIKVTLIGVVKEHTDQRLIAEGT